MEPFNKSYKVKLNISSKHILNYLKGLAGSYRFLYNLGTQIQERWIIETIPLKEKYKYLSISKLQSLMEKMEDELFPFIKDFDRGILSAAAHASSRMFTRSFRYRLENVHYLSRKKDKMSFKTRTKLKITNDGVVIPKLGKLKFYEKGRIPLGVKYSNITFSNDGSDWFMSLDIIDEPEENKEPLNGPKMSLEFNEEGQAVINGLPIGNIVETDSYKEIERKYKRALKKLKRQSISNLNDKGKVVTSRNMMKTRKIVDKLERKLYNKRKDYFSKVAFTLARTKPEECHTLATGTIYHEKQRYLSRKQRRAGVNHFLNVILKKLIVTGTKIVRHFYSEELYLALGPRTLWRAV